MTEAPITRRFKKLVKDLWSWKISDRYQSGVADMLVLVNGMAHFVELKAEGKEPRPLQKKWGRDVVKIGGGEYHVVNSKAKAEQLARELLCLKKAK